MRTRTRNNVGGLLPALPGVLASPQHYDCSGNLTTDPQSTFGAAAQIYLTADFERITDTTGRSTANQVVHRRFIKALKPISTSWYPYYGGPGRVSYGQANAGIAQNSLISRDNEISGWDVGSNTSIPPGFSISTPVSDDGAITRELLERARELKADVVLNIVESNQVWPSIRSIAGCIPALARNWNRARLVLKTAGSSYLAWKFGISPIIGDLTSIAKFAPQMKKDYDRFRNGDNTRYSKVQNLNITFNRPKLTYMANGVVASEVTYQGYSRDLGTTRHVLVVKPNAPKYQSEAFAVADYTLRRFGTSPARLAWEKIPFSFMLDWFVDVRSCLDKIDNVVGVTPYTIISYSKSTKWKVIQTIYQSGYITCPSHGLLYDSPVASAEYHHYARVPLSPNTSVQWKPRFGKNQAGITAALIAANLKKLRKP